MKKNSLAWLDWASAEIIERDSLRRRLLGSKPLKVKLGIDPTSKDLHLGHGVVLRKLRQFQDAGCKAILVIGDFTATIGDPSMVNKTRKPLSSRQVKENMKTYLEQASSIIDIKSAEVVYNSSWLGRLNLEEFVSYAGKVSLVELIERKDFALRLKSGQPVALHELLYAVAMAIDSVHLKADVELGGLDQKLNMLLGRALQKKVGQKPQELVMTELLPGTNSAEKMSNSEGNYIGLREAAPQMFAKLMAIPDELIEPYARLAAMYSEEMIKSLKKEYPNPKDRKGVVAEAIVSLYHGSRTARQAAKVFDETFRQKKIAEQLINPVSFNKAEITLLEAVSHARQVSRSQAQRLVSQGAVKVDGRKILDPQEKVKLTAKVMLQVGPHSFYSLSRHR